MIVSVFLSCLSGMQRASPILYCCLWPIWLHHVFPHYLVNGTIFGKKVFEYKICVLFFSKTFVLNISPSEKNWARYHHKCTLVFI